MASARAELRRVRSATASELLTESARAVAVRSIVAEAWALDNPSTRLEANRSTAALIVAVETASARAVPVISASVLPAP